MESIDTKKAGPFDSNMTREGCQSDPGQNDEGMIVPGKLKEALHESRNRNRTILESMDEGFCIIQVIFGNKNNPIDYRFIETNPAFERLTGFKDAKGKGMADLAPGYRFFGFGLYKRLIRSGKPLHFRHKGKSKGRWYDVHVLPYGGEESGMVAVLFSDITKPRQWRSTIEAQNATLEAINAIYEKSVFSESVQELGRACLNIIESATGSEIGYIGEVDADGVLRDTVVSDRISCAGRRSHGLLDTIINRGKTLVTNELPAHIKAVSLPEGHPVIRSLLGTPFFRGGKAVGLVAVVNKAGGYKNEDVELIEAVAPTIFEVIGHKRTQESMGRQAFFYNSLLNNIGDFVFVLDSGRRFVYANRPLEGQWGLGPGEYKGKTCAQLGYSPEICEYMDRQIDQVFETGRPVGKEMAVSHPAGSAGFQSFRFYPMEGAAGVEYVVGTARDTTERRRMEDALRQSEERAVTLVEKLRTANDNKNHFIHMLSHELRNPLAAIMASLSLLGRVSAGSEQDRKVRGIMEHQAGQLSGLVDDLLDVTRIGQNKITLKKECVNINDLILRTAEDNRSQFTEKGVALLVETMARPLYLEADPVRMTQAIGNLLHNAAKFTVRGDKTVVKVSMDEENREAVITVRDTGMGIQPERLHDLFEPFVQNDRSLDRSQGGLGLGLTIVKGMVDLHGGSVAAFSEGKGKGMTITLRLPVGEQEEDVSVDKDTAAPIGNVHGLRILVIDDIRELADMFSSLLDSYGHETRAVYYGPDGIREARSFRPDVIICDIGLPGMNGYEVARIIRADDELKNIYLIAISGYAQKRDIRKSREAGFDRHVAKPIKFDVLHQMIMDETAVKKSAGK